MHRIGKFHEDAGEEPVADIYDDLVTAQASWRWLKLYLTERKRTKEIAEIDVAFKKMSRPIPSYGQISGKLSEDGEYLQEKESQVYLSDQLLNGHTAVFGAIGSGKTNFAELLIQSQLRQGASLVAIDPKPETLRRIRNMCAEADRYSGAPLLYGSDVALIDSTSPDDIPAFNPLLAGEDPDDSARIFYDWISKGEGKANTRMWTFLRNAIVVAAWHGLPLGDVLRLLKDQDYLYSKLRVTLSVPESPTYVNAVKYFVEEYAKLEKSERKLSVASVEDRFNAFAMSSVLQRMTNVTKNTVYLSDLFLERKALLVSTATVRGMGKESVNMVVGLVLSLLNDAAIRYGKPDSRKVVLYMDEAGTNDPAIIEQLNLIVNVARERGIRLILAAQHPYQLPERIRRDVVSNAAVRVFFRSEGDGASLAASLLAERTAGEEDDTPPRLVSTGEPIAVYKGQLFYRRETMGSGELVPLFYRLGRKPPEGALTVNTQRVFDEINLFVHNFSLADEWFDPPLRFSNGVPVDEAITGLPRGSVGLGWVDGLAYCMIGMKMMAIQKKRPRNRDYWGRTVRSLPRGRAVVYAGGSAPAIVDIGQAERAPDASDWFLSEARETLSAPRYVPEKPPIPTDQELNDPRFRPRPATKSRVIPGGEDDGFYD